MEGLSLLGFEFIYNNYQGEVNKVNARNKHNLLMNNIYESLPSSITEKLNALSVDNDTIIIFSCDYLPKSPRGVSPTFDKLNKKQIPEIHGKILLILSSLSDQYNFTFRDIGDYSYLCKI